MRIRMGHVLLGFTLVGAPLQVFADPITVLSVHRSISNSASVGNSSTGTTSLFDNDRLSNQIGAINGEQSAISGSVLLSQTSPADGFFTANGSTTSQQNSTTLSAGAHAQLTYGFTFDLNEAQDFVFSGNYEVGANSATNRASWSAQLFFFPPGPNATTAFDFSSSTSQRVLEMGRLGPGRYGFFTSAVSDSFGIGIGRSDTAFHFSLEFSDPGSVAATPEPASMLLLGTGLAALLGGRRLTKSRH